MNERRYGIVVLILSVFGLLISASPVLLTLLDKCFGGFGTSINWVGCLWMFGWIPGLAIAVISLIMARRVRNNSLKISIWLLSLLAIFWNLFWIAAMAFFMLVLPRILPSEL